MSEVARRLERFERYCDRLTDTELLLLHRVVARRTVPLWRKVKPGQWETGVAASRAKQRVGYAAWRESV